MWFYARLKGRDPEVIKEESEQMIDDLVLKHKKNEISKNLSGGMQRKLSIATAFVGGSKTIILGKYLVHVLFWSNTIYTQKLFKMLGIDF